MERGKKGIKEGRRGGRKMLVVGRFTHKETEGSWHAALCVYGGLYGQDRNIGS